jgi:hypothetical protein
MDKSLRLNTSDLDIADIDYVKKVIKLIKNLNCNNKQRNITCYNDTPSPRVSKFKKIIIKAF